MGSSRRLGPPPATDVPTPRAPEPAGQPSPPPSHDSHAASLFNDEPPPREQNVVGLSFYVPILLHPVPHFFVGLGPSATVELSHEVAGVSNAATTIGFGSTVGGWI